MAALLDNIDAFKGAVPKQYQDVYNELAVKANLQLSKFESLKTIQIKNFNKLAKAMDMDAIRIKK